MLGRLLAPIPPLSVALTGLAIAVAPLPALAYDGDFSGVPQVRITGRAAETHTRDRAAVRLRVDVREDDFEKANAALVERSARLMSLLHEQGFSDAELSTWGPMCDELWVETRPPNGGLPERKKIGVTGRWGVDLTVTALDRPEGRSRLGAAATAAGFGGASIERMTYEVTDRAKIQERLDRRAAKDAREKANELILAAGARPGRLLQLSDTDHHQGGNAADLVRASPQALKIIPILPGEETIEAQVEAIVEIITP